MANTHSTLATPKTISIFGAVSSLVDAVCSRIRRMSVSCCALLILSMVSVHALPATAAEPFVPAAASTMAKEIDAQVAFYLGTSAPASGVSLAVTTPLNNNNLEQANALARQVQEELARWFVQAGYDVLEIRKGRDILFEPKKGESVLTRKERLVGNRKVTSTAILTGTYTVTPYNVRFNIRMIRTADRQTLGMSTVTIPIDREVAALIQHPSGRSGTPIEPTVVTLLP